MFYVFAFFVICAIAFVIVIWLFRDNSKPMSITDLLQSKVYYIIWRKGDYYAYSEVDAKNPDDALFRFRCQYPGRKLLACSTDIDFIRRKYESFIVKGDK